jgi:hypothetical protein
MRTRLELTKVILIRITGAFFIIEALLGVFLLLNPATKHRLWTYAPLVDLCAFIIGIGLVFLRRWAAVAFLLAAAYALYALARESRRPDIWHPAILINVVFIVIPIWACIAGWRQLRW